MDEHSVNSVRFSGFSVLTEPFHRAQKLQLGQCVLSPVLCEKNTLYFHLVAPFLIVIAFLIVQTHTYVEG